MRKFYSSAFPMAKVPNKIYNYDSDEFQKVIDTLFLLTDFLKDAHRAQYFKKPMNISVIESNSYLILGINYTRALKGLTIMTVATKSLSDKKTKDPLLKRSLENELGFTEIALIRLNKSQFKNIYQELLKLFNFGKDPRTRFNNMKSHRFSKDLSECMHKMLHDIKAYSMYGGGNGMWIDPRFQARKMVIKPNQGFYVLPFEKGPENVMSAIKDKIKDENIDCKLIKSEDVFDPVRGNNIVENIWQDICTSKFIIADISNKNPNVFYELGICDTIGKTIIMLCSKNSLKNDYNNQLPFDIATQYTIIYDEDYNGYNSMREAVVERIKKILKSENDIEYK